jgi:hypothetical protein
MSKRKLFLIAVTVVVGCSDRAEPLGVPPQTRAEDKRERITDEGEPQPQPGGIDKCRIYRMPECLQ